MTNQHSLNEDGLAAIKAGTHRLMEVETFATATIVETWTIAVPIGVEVTDDNALDMINGEGEGADTVFVGVIDCTHGNEQDREVKPGTVRFDTIQHITEEH